MATGLAVDGARVGLLSGAHRLWELAVGAVADRPALVRRFGDWVEDALGRGLAQDAGARGACAGVQMGLPLAALGRIVAHRFVTGSSQDEN